MQEEQQGTKGEVVKYRTHHTEGQHKLANGRDVPASRIVHHFVIHPIGGNRHLRDISQQIGEQNLLGEQGEKRQEEGDAGHAEHVAEIGACGHEYILQRVREGRPPFTYPLHQHTEILVE
jgi:hypothetical protein